MAPTLDSQARAPLAPLGDAPRVLVVRTGAIGDVVNALVFADAVRRARPDAHIGWVAHPLVAPLLVGNPAVDAVHVWPRGSGWRGVRALLGALRGARYDLAVDLQRLQKSALVARLSGAPRVLGYDRGRAKELSHLWTKEHIAPGDPRAHMVDQYREFARALGLPTAAPRWPLPPLDEARAQASRALAPLAGAPFVVLNLGASKAENRWAPEHFAALADRRTGAAPAMVLTGGPGDRDAADRVLRATRNIALDLVGRTGLLELAAVLERARCVVTGDTGPMHLAVAVGAPVLALFGPADPKRTGPYGAPHHDAPPAASNQTSATSTVLRVPPWDGTFVPTATLEALHPEIVSEALQTCISRG
ncbi:MAG: glycosyltransferase family 9 protein [Planctomycetota bacterium]